MTKPMPFYETDRQALDGKPAIVWHNGRGASMFVFEHEADELAAAKRLTDAECAAEYWRVCADMAGNAPTVVSPAVIRKHIRVWERFATLPHAHEDIG